MITAARKLISISAANYKMGPIPSISLPVGLTCAPGIPCRSKCYAAKMCRRWKSIGTAWMRNWDIYLESPAEYFEQVEAWLILNRPWAFRWHVGGDIPNYAYLEGMIRVAESTSRTLHWGFTKRYEILDGAAHTLPPNLTILASAWPGLLIPHDILDNYPIAWMADKDGTETRIPAHATHCPGKCYECTGVICTNLAPGEAIVLDEH